MDQIKNVDLIKDYLKHMRSIHFTIISISFILIFGFLVIISPNKYDKIKDELDSFKSFFRANSVNPNLLMDTELKSAIALAISGFDEEMASKYFNSKKILQLDSSYFLEIDEFHLFPKKSNKMYLINYPNELQKYYNLLKEKMTGGIRDFNEFWNEVLNIYDYRIFSIDQFTNIYIVDPNQKGKLNEYVYLDDYPLQQTVKRGRCVQKCKFWDEKGDRKKKLKIRSLSLSPRIFI